MNTIPEKLIALFFAIGIGDAFRCYFKAFVKAGGMKNFWFSHIYASAAGVLRFALYFAPFFIVMILSRAFG